MGAHQIRLGSVAAGGEEEEKSYPLVWPRKENRKEKKLHLEEERDPSSWLQDTAINFVK